MLETTPSKVEESFKSEEIHGKSWKSWGSGQESGGKSEEFCPQGRGKVGNSFKKLGNKVGKWPVKKVGEKYMYDP